MKEPLTDDEIDELLQRLVGVIVDKGGGVMEQLLTRVGEDGRNEYRLIQWSDLNGRPPMGEWH